MQFSVLDVASLVHPLTIMPYMGVSPAHRCYLSKPVVNFTLQCLFLNLSTTSMISLNPLYIILRAKVLITNSFGDIQLLKGKLTRAT